MSEDLWDHNKLAYSIPDIKCYKTIQSILLTYNPADKNCLVNKPYFFIFLTLNLGLRLFN